MDSVLRADVLVLMPVVFVRFGKTHGGKAPLQERDVVAAAAVAVAAVDHVDLDAANISFAGFFDIPGKLAGGGIILSAYPAAGRGLLLPRHLEGSLRVRHDPPALLHLPSFH